MTTGIGEQVALAGMARLADYAITMAIAGLIERPVIVEFVRKLEAEGKTPDQITDALQAMALSSESAARNEVRNTPQ
jgi:hypothetical protein